MDTVIGNITDAVKKGVVEIAQQALKEIFNVLQSLPTPYIPNTVDFALSLIPVAVPVLDVSRGVSLQVFMATSTMGFILKEVFRSW